ncbi:MAG: hypothetical protein BMS9Abin36_0228 [Gammaproteobacteria bacterium]|nr:MAG: hypothetical protein BMS9Abin36_0228 [Gammaproteobacteria bacterium]
MNSKFAGMAISWLLLLASQTGMAAEVEIVNVELVKQGSHWRATTTLKHGDTGWDHYADAWRVVTPGGEVLATRTLFHPHVDEQPFTRRLGQITIPKSVSSIYIEAHDKVHGWSRQRVKIDLKKSEGKRYRVR